MYSLFLSKLLETCRMARSLDEPVDVLFLAN